MQSPPRILTRLSICSWDGRRSSVDGRFGVCISSLLPLIDVSHLVSWIQEKVLFFGLIAMRSVSEMLRNSSLPKPSPSPRPTLTAHGDKREEQRESHGRFASCLLPQPYVPTGSYLSMLIGGDVRGRENW